MAEQDLEKIGAMLHLNIEALTILSSLFVRDYKDIDGTQLINMYSCGGYTIVPTAVTYCAAKFLCQHVYGGTGVGTERDRGKNESKGAGACGDKDGVRHGGK